MTTPESGSSKARLSGSSSESLELSWAAADEVSSPAGSYWLVPNLSLKRDEGGGGTLFVRYGESSTPT